MVPVEDLETYTILAHDPSKVGNIRSMYGLDAPVFNNLDGSVNGEGTVVSLDAEAVLNW